MHSHPSPLNEYTYTCARARPQTKRKHFSVVWCVFFILFATQLFKLCQVEILTNRSNNIPNQTHQRLCECQKWYNFLGNASTSDINQMEPHSCLIHYVVDVDRRHSHTHTLPLGIDMCLQTKWKVWMHRNRKSSSSALFDYYPFRNVLCLFVYATTVNPDVGCDNLCKRFLHRWNSSWAIVHTTKPKQIASLESISLATKQCTAFAVVADCQTPPRLSLRQDEFIRSSFGFSAITTLLELVTLSPQTFASSTLRLL